MRLGVNATFLNETPTGVGVYTEEVAGRLCALNRETIIFSSVAGKSPMESCIKKTPGALRGSLHLFPNLLRLLYANTALPALLKRCGAEILYCPILEFPFIPSAPLVVTVHDIHPIYFPLQFGLAAHHFKLSLKLLPRVARRVIVPSAFVKRELLNVIRLSSDSIDVIHNGYNAALFKPQDSATKKDFLKRYGIREPFILFVGSLFPYKNVHGLLDAFREVRNRVPHSLVIVGKRELSGEAAEGDERILYTGYVAHEDLPKFYSFADVAVHPSLAEGFGMTILEAMACGTPVISSNRGSLPEVTADAGIIFEPDDGASLVNSILAVVGNERFRKELIEKGLARVKGFSWEKTAEGVLRSCENALKGVPNSDTPQKNP